MDLDFYLQCMLVSPKMLLMVTEYEVLNSFTSKNIAKQ